MLLIVRYIDFTFMKKTNQTKRFAADKSAEKSVTSTQSPIKPPTPAVESSSFDPERDELAYDENGQAYKRKTPLGMLEDAEREADQRELADYRDTISNLRKKGFSFREIGEFLSKRGVFADHNAVYRIFSKFMTPEEMETEVEIAEEKRDRALDQ
jgi:hypothetical protein